MSHPEHLWITKCMYTRQMGIKYHMYIPCLSSTTHNGWDGSGWIGTNSGGDVEVMSRATCRAHRARIARACCARATRARNARAHRARATRARNMMLRSNIMLRIPDPSDLSGSGIDLSGSGTCQDRCTTDHIWFRNPWSCPTSNHWF